MGGGAGQSSRFFGHFMSKRKILSSLVMLNERDIFISRTCLLCTLVVHSNVATMLYAECVHSSFVGESFTKSRKVTQVRALSSVFCPNDAHSNTKQLYSNNVAQLTRYSLTIFSCITHKVQHSFGRDIIDTTSNNLKFMYNCETMENFEDQISNLEKSIDEVEFGDSQEYMDTDLLDLDEIAQAKVVSAKKSIGTHFLSNQLPNILNQAASFKSTLEPTKGNNTNDGNRLSLPNQVNNALQKFEASGSRQTLENGNTSGNSDSLVDKQLRESSGNDSTPVKLFIKGGFLDSNQADLIINILDELVLNSAENNGMEKVRFTGNPRVKFGAIIVGCATGEAKEWLQMVAINVVFRKANLRLCIEDYVEEPYIKPLRTSVVIKRPIGSDQKIVKIRVRSIFKSLEIQNPGVDTTKWAVVFQKKLANKPDSLFLIVTMDPDSFNEVINVKKGILRKGFKDTLKFRSEETPNKPKTGGINILGD